MNMKPINWCRRTIVGILLACAGQGCGEESATSAPSRSAAPRIAESAPESVPKSAVETVQAAAVGTPKGRLQTTTAAGPLVIVPESIEFGAVAPGSINSGTFLIRNGGSRPVKVLQVKPSCVCTTLSDLAGTSIPAGGVVELEASLDAPGEPGKKEAKVFVQLEGMSRPAIVRLGGMVTMPVQPEPPFASALKGVESGTIRLTSIDGRPFQVLASNGRNPEFVGFDSDRDELRNAYDIRWSIAGMPPASIPRWWVFTTDRPDCPLVPCRVRNENTGSKWDEGRLERRWIPSKDFLNLNRVSVGQTIERVIEIDHYNPRGGGVIDRPQWRDDVRIASMDPRIRVSLESTSPAGSEKELLAIRLQVVGPPTPLFYGNLEITTATGAGMVELIAEIVP